MRAIGLVVAIGIGLFVVATQLGNPRQIESYQVLDEDTILIQTSEGRLNWTRVTRVVETAESVDLTVTSFQAPVPGTDEAYLAFFVVDLESPLGDRRVLDRGSEVPLALSSDLDT